MLSSLHLANQRKDYASSSEDEVEVANCDRGTLQSGLIALEKIKTSNFDNRDQAKLEFLNLYHTSKNFRINA